MKRYNFFKYLPILFLFLLSACSEDFLQIDPAGKIESSDFPANDDEVWSMMVGGYNLMQWNYGRDWNSAFFVKNLPADDVNAGSSASDQLSYQNLDDFKNEADNTVTTAIWEGFYKTINHCNTIIERVGTSNSFREQIVAEAKAMRAWNYFELVVMFGDVPFFTQNATDDSGYNMPRVAKATIYEQIETDLIDAISVLSLKSTYSDNHKFRIAKGAAQAMLGKVYLYQEKWSEAHEVLSQVILTEGTEYDLEPVFDNIWRRVGEFGVESVFELEYTQQEGYDWGNFGWNGEQESNIHVQLMGPRSPFFSNLDKIGIIPGWGFNLPTAKIGSAFNEMGDNGPRYKASLMSETEFLDAGGSIVADEDEDGNAVPAHDYEGYLRLKYATFASETNSRGGAAAELNYSTNWRLIRYADVLLMAAEAYNEDDKPELGVVEINKVRKRAELDELPLSISQADLREAIIKERQLELAFEGCRYWDLIRWGLAEQELGAMGFMSNKHELFPIPQSEISANTAISQEDQNPGH
ncbi:RagB/SusD family nutrient uptake outer membrane protein [Geofilum sp. OHC36d9]|uniref:RagB/SusD family nutrient uptake outer membrane protein n=1 Tax=Geofilum sp. OHC36d9 TaxID=3458413 RepID=UPI004033C06C